MLRETDSGGFGSNCILKQGLDRGQIACRRKGGPPSQIAQITNKNRVYWVCGVQMYADLSEHDPPPPLEQAGLAVLATEPARNERGGESRPNG